MSEAGTALVGGGAAGLFGETCWSCGYDLRSQTGDDARCPECGLTIAETIDRRERLATFGNVRGLGRACWFAVLAVVIVFGGYLSIGALIMLIAPRNEALFLCVLAACSLVAGGFVWVASRAITVVPTLSRARSTRRLLRACGWIIPAALVLLWLLALAT